MKQYITPYDIANQVRMMRPVFDGSVIVVEGDSDARVYVRFVDEKQCKIIPAFGKANVLNAIALLKRSNSPGVLAIVDSDFWKLEGIEPPEDNVFTTDTHDLETMIVSSRAFDAIMIEFGSERKIARMGGSIREMILGCAVPVGFIRWISSSNQENLSLRFKDISFAAVVEYRGSVMKTNIDALINELKRNSVNGPVNVRDIKLRLKRLMSNASYDPWHVSRGHDLVHILTIGLREVFGNRHAKDITYEQVDRILRLSYGFTDFASTRLSASLTAWEKNNPGYPILREI